MSNTERQTTSGGIGFFGVLGIVFIILKLCGVIDWAWWIVLSPIWGSIALSLLIFIIILGVSIWKDTN